MKSYDAVVIGGGPAGVTAAMYLARSGCSVLLPERLTSGGQLLQTEALENYPGFPKGIKGYELADLFTEHLEGLTVDRPAIMVESISGSAGQFAVHTAEEDYLCKVVLVCSGAKHRQLGLEGEDRLRGRGVSYCALCDGNFFRNQTVAVVGGGNAAMEESLYLTKIVSKLHLIHRRDSFRGLKVYQDRLESMPDKVDLLRSSIITQLHGEDHLTGLTVKNLQTGQEKQLAVDGLFIYVGFAPVTNFLPQGIELDAQGFIVTDTEMRTNIPGIFAAGDIRSKLCRQVITAAGDGATAAQAAFVFLEQLHA
ncbi:thioredoxin-disulfide reductase [Desulfovibrio sp.]|uniref:thioredoxin-disulfide reductase n=1 Tax=Desulfovibrio sp. TaxID=885 RepID=UPI002A358E0F|nr:thioredoxin-disulfide reductase [Desulfovibrio sp.]MDY0258450.1 thioredoxin-disulfide reductase [Desulfovibrio sp.]